MKYNTEFSCRLQNLPVNLLLLFIFLLIRLYHDIIQISKIGLIIKLFIFCAMQILYLCTIFEFCRELSMFSREPSRFCREPSGFFRKQGRYFRKPSLFFRERDKLFIALSTKYTTLSTKYIALSTKYIAPI